MNSFNLKIWFSEKHVTLSTIEAESDNDAILKAYYKFSHKKIFKIDIYKKNIK